jgi:uncharacterized protein YndB with AHSA1/START domain
MTQSLIAKKTVTIAATPDRIWDALTVPEQVAQYMFGAEVVSDWKQGGPVVYRGQWEGQPFEDKGTILDIDAPLLLRMSYHSPMSGKPDTPENRSIITYALSRDGKATRLAVTQSVTTPEEQAQSEANWGMSLDAMKAMIEA